MRIRRTLIVLLFNCLSYTSLAQEEISIEASENADLIKVLNSAQLIAENKTPYLALRIYEIDNGTASAGYPSSEVTHDLLIAVSSFDEEPQQNLFRAGPFINPKVTSWKDDKEYEKIFAVEYGPYDNRQSVRLGVDLQVLWIIE